MIHHFSSWCFFFWQIKMWNMWHTFVIYKKKSLRGMNTSFHRKFQCFFLSFFLTWFLCSTNSTSKQPPNICPLTLILAEPPWNSTQHSHTWNKIDVSPPLVFFLIQLINKMSWLVSCSGAGTQTALPNSFLLLPVGGFRQAAYWWRI